MSGYVQAQKLNRRITIERKTTAKDSFGQTQQVWLEVCKLWAQEKSITGSGFVNQEFATAGTEVSRATASFRVRRRAGISAGMRVVERRKGWPTTYYDIKVVLPDLQDGRFMDLGVATGANEG